MIISYNSQEDFLSQLNAAISSYRRQFSTFPKVLILGDTEIEAMKQNAYNYKVPADAPKSSPISLDEAHAKVSEYMAKKRSNESFDIDIIHVGIGNHFEIADPIY